MSHTTIRFTKENREYIGKSADKHSKPMGEFAYQCVYFVTENGYNPFLMEQALASEEMKKLKSQLISFIRTQEKEYIKPLAASMTEVKKELINYRGVLQQIQINTAEPEGLKTTAIKPLQDERHSDLLQALKEKEEALQRAINSLRAINSVSVPGKRDVTVQMTPEEFKKLVDV